MNGAEVPESLDEWQQIQSPVGIDMAVIRDNYLDFNKDRSFVFPPSHHEGLQLQVTQQDLQAPAVTSSEPRSLSSSSSSSGSEVEEEEYRRLPPLRVATNEIGRRWGVRFEILRTGIFHLASRVRSCAVCSGGFWSIASVTGVVAAVLLSFLYVRVQRRRQGVHQESRLSLFSLIREKDEKIGQLLLHIAQMDEVLLARRRVPVLRIG
ncbi:hypothetical protein I3843_06G082900 [Carya illinoinensis]|uniref:Uncharacterized protein n=1 Tax=Carya illinoinensis TaxID=32201 RepID=A0A8T1Q9I1_CARIL|nr:uncharacterized protein LOC122313490 [Carya illinoinensis]KAG6651106.1 hypothetical protein CIPAW_06G088700 [Carya illinoinensis]KAG6708590.1 hypothetical protein I3842_06G088800 [Carya illinoinensis]KAG7975138.1 hypothetical protein I3843_06G082900 [Carya illinoinensis]